MKGARKDRCSELLSEASSIRAKYLLTLEPGISASQPSEMHSRSLEIVILAELHAAFAADRRSQLISFGSFIQLATSFGSATGRAVEGHAVKDTPQGRLLALCHLTSGRKTGHFVFDEIRGKDRLP